MKSDSDPEPCHYCGGTGWKFVAGATEKRVVRCVCYFSTQTTRLLESAHIPARYTRCSFSSYQTSDSGYLTTAKLAVEKWTTQYPLDRTGLLLLGSSGVGKTHLAVAALIGLISKGFHCLFCDYRDLLKQIQNSYNPSVQTTELELLQPVFKSDVLLLDDLGASKPSQWVWDTVSLILNNRYNENRTTIITSNFLDGPAAGTPEAKQLRAASRQATPEPRPLPAEEDQTLADRIGERMRSRLFEMCRPVLVVGSDYRRTFRSANLR